MQNLTMHTLPQLLNNCDLSSYLWGVFAPLFSTKSLFYTIEGLFVFSATSLPQNKRAKTQFSMNYPYKECCIKSRNGDLSKRWYLEFYAWSEVKKKLVRLQIFCPSTEQTAKKRMSWLRLKSIDIDYDLRNGTTVEILKGEKEPKTSDYKYLTDAIDEVLNLHLVNTRKKTIQGYWSKASTFKKFLESRKLSELLCFEFKTEYAYDYLQFVVDLGDAKSNWTINNHIRFLKFMFKEMVSRDWIEKNPFDKIKRKPTNAAPNFPFSQLEKKQLLNAADHQTKLFLKFMYYSFLRPTELRHLKIGDIKKDKIYVSEKVSKNRKAQYVVIVEGLKQTIKEYNLTSYNPNLYVFSKDGLPSDKPVADNYFYNIHKKMLDDLGIENKTLYSWKDTGICDFYVATKDLIFVSKHARHYSVDMTRKYLESVGILSDKSNLEKVPIL